MYNRRICQKCLKIFKRNYNWTPIAKAFNNIATIGIKTDSGEQRGLFNIPELSSPEGFTELKRNCIRTTNRLITEATSPARQRKMVEIFDELSNTLCKVADLSEFIRLAHPNGEYARRAEDACITVSGIVENLNTDYKIYDALKAVVRNGDIVEMNDVDRLVGELFLFDFEQSGIHLPERDRTEVVQLNNAILHMGQKFMADSSKARRFRRNELPKDVRKLFDSSGDYVVVNGLLGESSDPLVREHGYKLFLTAESQQEELLMAMLRCRYQLARKCGFETYSER